MSKQKFNLGQEIWFVPIYNGAEKMPSYVKIIKLGRKYIYFDNGLRASKDGLLADNKYPKKYYFKGNFYLCKEDWEEKKLPFNAWKKFCIDVSRAYTIPNGIGVSEINEARKLLGI